MARRSNGKKDQPIIEELTAEGGGPAQDVAGAWVGQLKSNRDDPVLALRGGGLEIFEKVLTDDQVFSNFQQRRLALLSKKIEVQAGAKDKQSVAAADFLRDTLTCLNFDRICNRMLYGIFYGYSVGECLWARDGQHWRLETIKVRKARRFRYDTAGRLRLLKTTAPAGIVMPERKFWTFESGSDHDDNPYGVGLGSYCYWPAFFKRNGIRFWLLALEKYGAPTAVGTYPANATQKEKEKLLEAVIAFASVSGLTIPEGMNIDLLTAGTKVGGNHDKLVEVMNKSISKVILSQTMTTDDGSSNAQSQTHLDVREDITSADADLQCGSFMEGPGRWLMEWNYPGAALPSLSRVEETHEDLDQRAQRDRTIYEMGFKPTLKHIHDVYGTGYEQITPPVSAPGQKADGTDPEFAEERAPETAVDAFLASDEHAGALERETEDLIQQVETVLEQAENDEEAIQNLMKLLGVPRSDAFANRMAKASFNARLHGRAALDPAEEA